MSWLKAFFCLIASASALEYFSVPAGLLLLLVSVLWLTLADREAARTLWGNLIWAVPVGVGHYFGFACFVLTLAASVLIGLIALERAYSPASKI